MAILNFSRVSLESLLPGTSLEVDLYTQRNGDFVMYRKAGNPITRENQQSLLESGQRYLYIGSDDKSKFQRYLEANLKSIVHDPDVPAMEKNRIVYAAASTLMEELFEDPRSTENIRRSKQVIEGTVDQILSGRDAVRHLISITAHDYTTYTHSVNVTIFSVALCERIIGHDEGADFQVLGHGFLLHDLGKSLIDPDILSKPSKLTDEEWKVMKSHPEKGYEMLSESMDVAEEMRQIVLEHHERFCGGGYPIGKKGEDISLLGRICTISDVFDALTTRRCYKEPMSSFEALSLMKDRMKEHFDPDVFHEFVQILAK